MLTWYSTQQRGEYLHEVELSPERGRDEAIELHRLVSGLLAARQKS